MKRIIVTVSIVFVSAIIVILLLFGSIKEIQESKHPILIEALRDTLKDSIKLIIQLLFVVIGGHFIVTSYNVRRQKKADAKEFRRRIHKLLLSAYLNTKKSRLILRANCRNGYISYSVYEKEIKKIIDTKVELEIISHEIEENQKYFKDGLKIFEELDNMENYLRNLVKEYTIGNNPPFDGTDKLNIATLFHLNCFISGKQLDKQTEEEARKNSIREHNQKRSHFSLLYRKFFYTSLDILKEKEEKELVQN